MHRHGLHKTFVAYLFLLGLATASSAQELIPDVKLTVTGNGNRKLVVGETIRIIVTAEANIPGFFKIRLKPAPPDFAFDWDDKDTVSSGTATLSDTLVLAPGPDDCGRHTFVISAQVSSGSEIRKHDKTIVLTVVPDIRPEPPFTSGHVNEICWLSCDALNEELRFFPLEPVAEGGGAGLASTSGQSCKTVEGLVPGVKYGYFVESTLVSGTGFEVFRSDTVFSTQDNTPPPRVALDGFDVSATGDVTLRWRLRPDVGGYVERYVVWRKPADLNDDAYTVVDTVSFYPATKIAPANYVPAPLTVGQSVYVDAPDTVVQFPQSLVGAALIRTAKADRWDEAPDFLSFTLETPAYVYIAFDRKIRTRPLWLDEGFRNFRRELVTSEHPDGLVLFRSRTVLPPGRVTLGGNFAEGSDIFLAQPRMYAVVVQPVAERLPYASGEQFEFVDPLGAAHDQETFFYRVDALDAAQNLAVGIVSPPVILDLNGRCRPVPERWFVFENAAGAHFAQGAQNLVSVLDPNAVAECVGFRDSDSLRFQAVRQNPALFESHKPEDVGALFFDSGWLSLNHLKPDFAHRFDLLPPDQDPNFVNGQVYFYRVRAKDRHGNLSAWSDTVSAVQDFFPPTDISSLSAQNRLFPGFEDGCVDLQWGAAFDGVSGVHTYVVHRSEDGGTSFAPIASVPATQLTYCDTLSGIGTNKVVSYRVEVRDGVGNSHTIENSAWQATLRALVGPTIRPDPNLTVTCPTGILGIKQDTLTVLIENFDRTDVAGFLTEVVEPSGARVLRTVTNLGENGFPFPLTGEDGVYRIRLRAFYSNGDTTIFSNPLTVKKKRTLSGVELISADQDPQATGDILLNWSHPDSLEIVEYHVFAWPEGSPQPNEPQVVLPGHETQWRQRFEDGLVAYQCYRYLVRAVDCFGLVSEPNAVVSQYPNPPPVFEPDSTEVDGTTLRVVWRRPQPRFLQNDAFDAEVAVFQDSLGSAPDTVFTVFNKTSLRFAPEPRHNYFFRVREVILNDLGQACAEQFVSAWSEPMVVPFENQPAGVSFRVQPLPVPPGSDSGRVFISWEGYNVPSVNRFSVEWRSVSGGELQRRQVTEADTVLLRGLDVRQAYRFEVVAIDNLNQRSVGNDTALVWFQPRWQFTPRLQRLGQSCFGDSLRLSWEWVNENLEPVSGGFGAHRIEVELSLDPNFNFKKSSTVLDFTTAHTFQRERDYPFVTQQNNELFMRIRAFDRWNHVSPWSTEYPELGSQRGEYDSVPPEVVTCFVDSLQAPLFGGPGEVNVVLTWDDVDDDCSGAWFYEIVRDGTVIARDTSRVPRHRFVETRLTTDSLFLETTWKVFAVDSVGNRQNQAIGCRIPLLLTPPDSGACENDTTFCWSAGTASTGGGDLAYVIEGARFPEFFGNPETNNVLVGPIQEQCVDFTRPWEHIYWRVKSVSGNFESAWSDTFFCKLEDKVTGVADPRDAQVPQSFTLEQNYPNPFNPSTAIRYAIPRLGRSVPVRLEVFNIAGQQLRVLVDAVQGAGVYTVVWDGHDDRGNPVSSGVYLYKLQAGDYVTTRKMIFLK